MCTFLEAHFYDLNVQNAKDQDLKDRIYERLQARSECDPDTDCQIYLGAWTEKGNAKMRVGHRVYNLNRVAAWIFFEDFELWGENVAYHKCESPACFNPDHLGVAKDVAEALRKIHALKRPRAPGRRLNKAKAATLRLRHFDEGADVKTLAGEFHMGKPSVIAVIKNETWKDENFYDERDERRRCA